MERFALDGSPAFFERRGRVGLSPWSKIRTRPEQKPECGGPARQSQIYIPCRRTVKQHLIVKREKGGRGFRLKESKGRSVGGGVGTELSAQMRHP